MSYFIRTENKDSLVHASRSETFLQRCAGRLLPVTLSQTLIKRPAVTLFSTLSAAISSKKENSKVLTYFTGRTGSRSAKEHFYE